ncbi:MAG: hypothetical protein ACYDD1_23110, partial [Caulobacteraceae bacterium]
GETLVLGVYSNNRPVPRWTYCYRGYHSKDQPTRCSKKHDCQGLFQLPTSFHIANYHIHAFGEVSI